MNRPTDDLPDSAPADAAAVARPGMSRVLTRCRERFGRWVALLGLTAGVAALWWLPADTPRVREAAAEALALAHEYARRHVVLCLVPALYLAGGLRVLLSPATVMRYLGSEAPRPIAYATAAVGGTVLTVCSCTVLPLFAGIWRLGAGLGPATTFLFAGPAINVLAIVLTARVLGVELGVGRATAALFLSVLVGLAMAWWFRADANATGRAATPSASAHEVTSPGAGARSLCLLLGILVLANWGSADSGGWYGWVGGAKWWLAAACGLALAAELTRRLAVSRWVMLATAGVTAVVAWAMPATPEAAFLVATAGLALGLLTGDDRAVAWWDDTYELARQLIPALLVGVLLAGFLLGRPGHEALVPPEWVTHVVGGSSLGASLLAAAAGALMYLATLTEVPVLEGLLGSGMGHGPALAMLLAGPAISLPSLLALRSVLGTRKTLAYFLLVVGLSAMAGYLFGRLYVPPPS